MIHRIFCVGNGESRKGLNLEKLQNSGAVYGCNAVYRDFNPDALIAVDRGMMHEIYRSGYCVHNVCHFKDWTRVPGGEGFHMLLTQGMENISENKRGKASQFVMHGAEQDGLIRDGDGKQRCWISWIHGDDKIHSIQSEYDSMDAGPISVAIACKQQPEELFLVGHDLQAGKMINNMYKGTKNYFPVDFPQVFAGNWINNLSEIFSQNLNTTFYRVNYSTNVVEEWKDNTNVGYITLNELDKLLDN